MRCNCSRKPHSCQRIPKRKNESASAPAGASDKMLPAPGEQSPLLLRPADAVEHLPVTEQEDGRYPADVEPAGQAGVLLGVHLDDRTSPRQLQSHLSHHRCESCAVRSPGCPEFRQDRPGVPRHEGIEAPVGQRHRPDMERWQHGVTVAALPRFSLAGGRYPVGGNAGGAADDVCFARLIHGHY